MAKPSPADSGEDVAAIRHELAVGRVARELDKLGYMPRYTRPPEDLAEGEFTLYRRRRIVDGKMPCDLAVNTGSTLLYLKVAYIGTSFSASTRFMAHLVEAVDDFLIVIFGTVPRALSKFPRCKRIAAGKDTVADYCHVEDLAGVLSEL